MTDGHDHDDMMAWDAAAARVRSLRERWLERLEAVEVGLDEIAGRTLVDPIDAPADVPARSHATMDGFAFDATNEYPLSVVDDDVFPEDDPPAIDGGQAVRIATGAPLPPSANAVLKREEAAVADGQLTGTDLPPGTYVYERGSNVAEGERLFAAGERLSPKDAILLGDLGIDTVRVRERFEAGLLATGTEIHEGRHRDLDSPMLAGLIRSWGHRATYEGSVPDDYGRVESRIADLASEYDVVVTTGGTSVGDKDYVIRALDSLGEVLFHRVRLRPGKPIAVAELPDHDAVAVAVPGKPVGAHAVTTLVARPLFTGEASLSTVPARMARGVDIATPGFAYAIPVTLEGGDGSDAAAAASVDGGADDPVAMPLGHADSELAVYGDAFDPSVLSSSTRATRADGFVLTETAVERDESVRVVPYPPSSDDRGLPVSAPPFEPDPERSPARVAGVLLAAGTSSRFGEANKLLARLDGDALVRHAARTLVAASVSPVVVVVGYEADRVIAALDGLDVVIVRNGDYAAGQSTSVRAGIGALDDRDVDAAVVALGDMPFVDPETVRTLVSAYEAGVGDALAAAYDGDRGNPVVFDRRFFDALTRVDGDVGGREILLESDASACVAVSDSGVRRDIDEPGDL